MTTGRWKVKDRGGCFVRTGKAWHIRSWFGEREARAYAGKIGGTVVKPTRDELYYRRHIAGLILILQDADGMISTEYVIEKLKRIEAGNMSFHPGIESNLDRRFGGAGRGKVYNGDLK